MCGIIGYVGPRPVASVLLQGLRQLEYRGYDSAGIAAIGTERILIERAVREKNGTSGIDHIGQRITTDINGGVGIGHTRWATHGTVNVTNAHPHRDCRATIFIVHNGALTNDDALRRGLLARGHDIASETDSELIAHLIEERATETPTPNELRTIVHEVLELTDGAAAIVVCHAACPHALIAATRGSPLLIGIGQGECFIASDEGAVVGYTQRIVDLRDGDITQITADGIVGITRTERTATWSVEEAQRGEFPNFTRKEIAEQAETVDRAQNHGGRLISQDGTAKLGGLEPFADRLRALNRVQLIASGTAHHAALIGQQMLQTIAGIPHVEARLASEVRAEQLTCGEHDGVVAVSQSGETADTLLVLREAKRKGALTIGVVNSVATAIARETDCGVYCNAGPEIGVASTKAFVSQLTVLALIALFLGRQRALGIADGRRIVHALTLLPAQVASTIGRATAFAERAHVLRDRRTFFIIGRAWHYPVALEAALKMEELAYVNAKGYAAGEMKHGPLAVLSDDAVVIALAPRDDTFERVLLAVRQAHKTGALVLAITTPPGLEDVTAVGAVPFVVPETHPMLQPILSILPLQLFAYELAVALGRDVDKPRHLAKSVTVQ